MFCQYCDRDIPKRANFCPYCEKDLRVGTVKAAAASVSTYAARTNVITSSEPSPSRNTGGLVCLSCDHEVRASANFCPYCDASASQLVAPPSSRNVVQPVVRPLLSEGALPPDLVSIPSAEPMTPYEELPRADEPVPPQTDEEAWDVPALLIGCVIMLVSGVGHFAYQYFTAPAGQTFEFAYYPIPLAVGATITAVGAIGLAVRKPATFFGLAALVIVAGFLVFAIQGGVDFTPSSNS